MGSLDRLKDISGFMAGFPLDDTLGSATTRAIGGMLGTIALEIEREREQSAECGSCADAAEWVEEHGGLDAVKERWHGRVARAHVVHMAERQRERRERMQRHIEHIQRLCRERRERIKELNKAIAEMRPRLMPEGMEWPRYDTGELLDFGDEVARDDGESADVDKIVFYGDQWRLYDRYACEINEDMKGPGERVRHPAPKDDWERWRKDLEADALGYAQDAYHGLKTNIDFEKYERRAKALAGVSE